MTNVVSPPIAVALRNVERRYGTVRALRGVSADIPTGVWLGVRGRSGSGKTTLLNCIGGIDAPTAGTITCLGEDVVGLREPARTRWRLARVGFVFQAFALLPTLSAFENVELPLRIAGHPDRRRRALACLDRVGLSKWVDHRPAEMSGGQQQRVAIARALANAPRLLLADEPTGELDTATSRDILTLLREVAHEPGVTLIMSSHDPLALSYCDQVVEMRDGQLVG
ncbi:MAG: ABC transporter ATP-binding protein [Thermoflexales bacterium]|nr:ABC transporter ATP-binding protein [Thermoflexales bacterium]